MALGWRLIDPVTFEGVCPGDGVVTEPGTSVSEAFWLLSPGLRFVAGQGVFRGGGYILAEVSFAPEDVIQERSPFYPATFTPYEPVHSDGAGGQIPADPVIWSLKQVSAGSIEASSVDTIPEFAAVALAAEGS